MNYKLLLLILSLSHSLKTNDLYPDLLKKCLINTIYEDDGYYNKFDLKKREEGGDWPKQAFTMIGLTRLNNIEYCINEIIKNNVEGDFIETGVWRGGAVIFMRGLLKNYNITNRNVWVADSFEGLPLTNTSLYPDDEGLDCLHHAKAILGVSLDQVKNNFKKFDLLDDQVKFLKGWFKDTLPTAPIKKLSLIRLDGDLYESTMDALVNLYDKLSIGGYIIVDDFVAVPACAKAIKDFRESRNINDVMIKVGPMVFWKRTK